VIKHGKAADQDGDHGTPGANKCEKRVSGTAAGGRWRRQHKTELDGDHERPQDFFPGVGKLGGL